MKYDCCFCLHPDELRKVMLDGAEGEEKALTPIAMKDG